MKHSHELSFDEEGRPVLITAAPLTYQENNRQRLRKYLTLRTIRIPALILAAVAYGTWHNGLISLLIVAASIPLPWIAVLIANDRPPRRAEEPRRFQKTQRSTPLLPTAKRAELEPGTGFPPQSGRSNQAESEPN